MGPLSQAKMLAHSRQRQTEISNATTPQPLQKHLQHQCSSFRDQPGKTNMNLRLESNDEPAKGIGHGSVMPSEGGERSVGKISKSFMRFGVLHQQQICVVQMKGFINCHKIDELSHYAALVPNLQSLLQLSEEKYQTKLSQQTATSISRLVQQINQRERKKPSSKAKNINTPAWAFGERKVFCWALVFYTQMHQLDLQQLNDSHLTEIQTIFPQRSLEFLRYEIAAINSSKIKHRQCWTEPETRLLSEIVEKTSSKSGRGEEKYDWKQISFSLFCESKGAYFKPLQDCRQKWCNYLNPNLNKQQWSLEEDLKLFQLIEKEGCKWALISRKFELIRTEHMVKNRYNAYINNWKTKRSNVKSKRGLINRIYRYLKTRISKKQERVQNMDEQLSSVYIEETEKINEYSYEMAEESQEPFYGLPNTNALTARHCYDLQKKEKKTAESDEGELIDYSASNCCMIEQPDEKLLPYVLCDMEDEQLEPFNCDLLMDPMQEVSQRGQVKEEMKLIDVEVVQVLGCSHFERALKLDNNSFEDGESFSWLV